MRLDLRDWPRRLAKASGVSRATIFSKQFGVEAHFPLSIEGFEQLMPACLRLFFLNFWAACPLISHAILSRGGWLLWTRVPFRPKLQRPWPPLRTLSIGACHWILCWRRLKYVGQFEPLKDLQVTGSTSSACVWSTRLRRRLFGPLQKASISHAFCDQLLMAVDRFVDSNDAIAVPSGSALPVLSAC